MVARARGVGAVAGDRDMVGIHQDVVWRVQLDGDRASGVVASGLFAYTTLFRSVTQRDGRASSRYQHGVSRVYRLLLCCPALVVGRAVVGIATVAGLPG